MMPPTSQKEEHHFIGLVDHYRDMWQDAHIH